APAADAFPSYVGFVRDQLLRELPDRTPEHAGLVVFTPLDLVWQAAAEAALAAGVAALERGRGRMREPLEGAFVALDPSSGYVRVAVGGRAPRAGDFNRALQARRQPGSAMKPIAYAAAFDDTRPGTRFTPAT